MSGASPVDASPSAPTPPSGDRDAAVTAALKKIYDPEIPMNIVDLGLIYGIDWQEDRLTLRMTLTAPGCPVADILAEEIKATLEKVPNVKEAKVEFIWEPPWTPEKMSEFAKRQFGYL